MIEIYHRYSLKGKQKLIQPNISNSHKYECLIYYLKLCYILVVGLNRPAENFQKHSDPVQCFS